MRTVSDEEILAAYRELGRSEGVFVEPASGAGVAGVIKLADEGFFGTELAVVVCTLTGHGLKDPDRAVTIVEKPEKASAQTEAVVEMLGLEK